MSDLLTERETYQILTVSRGTLRNMWRDGLVPKPIRIGRRGIRWRRTDIEQFLAQRPGYKHPVKQEG